MKAFCRYSLFTLCLVVLASLLCGCFMADVRREFLGYSRSDILYAAKNYSKTFEAGPGTLFEKTLDALKKMEAVPYRMDTKKRIITAIHFDRSFHACIDTTAVGILIRPIDLKTSEVVVMSENSALAGFVADKLFSEFQK